MTTLSKKSTKINCSDINPLKRNKINNCNKICKPYEKHGKLYQYMNCVQCIDDNDNKNKTSEKCKFFYNPHLAKQLPSNGNSKLLFMTK